MTNLENDYDTPAEFEVGLSELAAAVEAHRATALRVEESVRYARFCGQPWSVIGEMLGTSKQAAWERYRDEA